MNLIIVYLLVNFINSIYTLSSFIKTYDSIKYDIAHKRYRRSLSDLRDNNEIEISFQAFNKNFNLKLSEDKTIFKNSKSILMNNDFHDISQDMVPVNGILKGNPWSHVYGTVVDGVFRGVISEDYRNTSSQKWFIEHSGYYFSEDPGFHSIIYHESHVQHNHSGCGLTDPEIKYKVNLLSQNQMSNNENRSTTYFNRHKRSLSSSFHNSFITSSASTSSQLVCNLYLQSDTFLWNKVMQLPHIKKKRHVAMKEISSIFTQHVQGAQAIYQHTVFQKFDGSGTKYNGIGFRVDRVRINTTDDCEIPELARSNPFCDENIDVTNFLNLNSYVRHDDFCLAYVFTYRDFSGGTLGLAWVAEPGGSGGVCEKHRMMQEGNVNVRKSLNTGIVTLLNYGSYVALKVSQLTFAHEMGHNFGSKHDDDHKDRRECLPAINDPHGNYIMFASATSGDKENNNKFSVCSKDSIARLLDRVTNSEGNCFSNQEGSFCGNKLTEEKEECDCGYSAKDCQDKCCHSKQSKNPCRLKTQINYNGINKKVQCSPTAGECCTDDCQFREAQYLCRTKGECYNAASCLGNSTKCPPSEKVKDLTKCQDNTRVCKNGECVGSICERLRGWQECSIVRSEKVTSEMLCYVACREDKPNAPCISTFDLAKNPKLRNQYPTLAHELLMPHNRAIQLKPGAPCDNYHGYCDVFFRCRSVEADGPLARIKNLIFSSKMMNKVRLWITQFWWAVMLMCIGAIVFIGLFLKICSRSTPSYDPRFPDKRYHHPRHHVVANGAPRTSTPVTAVASSNSSNPHHRRRNNRRNVRSASNKQRHKSSNHTAVAARPTAPPPPIPPVPLPSSSASSSQPQSSETNSSQNPPARPPRLTHQHQHPAKNRPISLIQPNGIALEATARPVSMNIESSIQIQEIYRPANGIPKHPAPSYPPPAYHEVSPLVMIPQQHGRGKRAGHRSALNQQASRYN